MDGIATKPKDGCRRIVHAVVAACATVVALTLAGPASAATHGGMLGAIRPQTKPASPLVSPFSAGQGSGQLTYHGGAVMRTNRVYAIYWVPSGYSVSAAYRTTIDGFFANVAADNNHGTNVYATDTQYSDGTGLIAYNSTFAGSVLDTQAFPASGCSNPPFATCLTDAQVVTEIARVQAAQGWARSANTIFVMFTPRNVGSCFGSGGTCFGSYYCAYHSWYTDGGGTLIYANQPYAASSSGCGGGWLNSPNHDDADMTLNVASHEHNETITDPTGGGWWDAAGYENGDKCAWDFGTQLGGAAGFAYNQRIGSGNYELQQEYSNLTSSCVQTMAIPTVPSNTVAPSVSGTTQVGSTLTAAAGTWSGSPTSYQYTWQRCTPTCASISGANNSTYTLTSSDLNAAIRVLVWAINIAGHGAAYSGQTATVTAGVVPSNTVAPSISGTVKVGSNLTVGPGTWSGSPTSYQYTWQRCTPTCASIANAHNTTYALVSADLGATIRVLVWALNNAGHGAAYTAQTAAVTAGTPTNTVAPSISGTAHVGSTLTVSPGTWTGAGPITYQYTWQRCTPTCASIASAWNATYAPVNADRGATLRVLVWAVNTAGHTAANTAQTAAVS